MIYTFFYAEYVNGMIFRFKLITMQNYEEVLLVSLTLVKK